MRFGRASAAACLAFATAAEAKRCKNVKVQIVETFDFVQMMCVDESRPVERGDLSNGCAGAKRLAGDYDVWDDYTYLMGPPTDPRPAPTPLIQGQLIERLGRHRGRCSWVGDSANHCEGTMVIDHPDYGTGTITIMGQTPKPILSLLPTNPEIAFTISGGTGDFEGAYGSATPGFQYAMDPGCQVTGKTKFPFFPELGFPDLCFPFFATYPFDLHPLPPFAQGTQFGNYTLVPEAFRVIVYEASFSCSKQIDTEL
uniref:Uncharacterized protein n=1 Tax=Trieres chinensis TaxID=1514140 RepID=A0A7S1ZJ24_TRICV